MTMKNFHHNAFNFLTIEMHFTVAPKENLAFNYNG